MNYRTFDRSHITMLFLVIFTFFVGSISLKAQNRIVQNINWRTPSTNADATFYEIQKEFNDYWENRTPQKGQSYKVFKRWENYMQPRVYPSGDILLPSYTYANYMEWFTQYGKAAKAQTEKSAYASNWNLIGPSSGKPSGYDSGVGRIDFVRFHPTDANTMFVGSPDGGLWKTTNGGNSWTTNTDFLPIIGCSDLAIDPNNPSIMYLATGNWEEDRKSIGILKTTNGGSDWVATSLTWTPLDNYVIRKLIMHPSNSNIMMAVTDGGVFRTTDGWASYSNAYCCNTLYDIEFKPGDPNTVYAVGQDFLKSTDAGATWNVITTGLPNSGDVSRGLIAVSAANSAYVYAIFGDLDGGFLGCYRSANSGSSFTLRSDYPNILNSDKEPYIDDPVGGQATHDLAIVVSPTDADLVTIGGINQWQSTDGGSNWDILSYWLGNDNNYPGEGDAAPDYTHADIQSVEYMPGSNTVMFATADGGIYKSVNGGTNWTDISGNINVAQQTGIALSATSPDILVTGLQDIGTIMKTGSSWSVINGGDGEDALIDRTNNNNIITSNPYGNYDLSTTGDANRNGINNGLPEGEWFSPLAQDPVVATTVYAGGRPALYKSTNIFSYPSYNWTAMGTPPGTDNILRFAIAPSNTSIIYAIKIDAVSKSINGGSTWSNMSGTLPLGTVMPTSIAVSNTDPNKAWVTFSGYTDGEKVYKTIDGGTSWTNISSGLPNIPVNAIVYRNDDAFDAVYIGADIGVYVYDNSVTSWLPFSTGLPNNHVTDLEIYYPTGKLRASTYGRGSWESDLPSSPLPAELVNFEVSLLKKDKAKLKWQTASELGVERFDVETNSNSNSNYKSIKQVLSKNNDNKFTDYELVVDNLVAGTNYFRLKIVDTDGQFTYSPIRVLTIGSTDGFEKLQIYPNPVLDFLTLEMTDNIEKIKLEIVNTQGQIVYKGEMTDLINIDVTYLKSGIYFVKMDNNKTIQFRKIAKN